MNSDENHPKQVQNFLNSCDLWRKSNKPPVVLPIDEEAIKWLLNFYKESKPKP